MLGDGAGGGVGGRAAQVGAGEVFGAQGGGGGFGAGRVGRVGAGIQHAAADGAVEQAGIEVAQAQLGGEPAGERAFAGGGGAVNGDDQAHRDGGAEPVASSSRNRGSWCR